LISTYISSFIFFKRWSNCMNKSDTYVYINSILIDDGDTKGSLSNGFILWHHVCHFIISFPLIYRRRRHQNKPRKRETMNRLYVCMWPIGIKHMHIVHTTTNGISLSYRHSRRTKKRKKKYCILCLSMDAGRIREREKKSARYIHIYIYTPLHLCSLYCC
jgi:hypothetical protein